MKPLLTSVVCATLALTSLSVDAQEKQAPTVQRISAAEATTLALKQRAESGMHK